MSICILLENLSLYLIVPKKVMHMSNVGTNLLHDSLEKAVVVDVPRLIYIAQSHVTYFAPGYMPKPLLSVFDYTV